ncbi:DUF3800 domain-containing protein [Candidatus Saccharibacteria bacterium]|nr:DUF3800 domain-containing protein [Candidatus Saccharibacteria bacterium]
MLVLIDESGDPGFKITKGSTPVFIITAVIFDDTLMAEKVAVDLKLLKRELKLPDDYEYHFYNTRPRIREAFLRKAVEGDFRVRSIVMDKSKITSDEFKNSKSSFYNYTLKSLLKDPTARINQASIKLDGRGDREYKRAAGTYLRRELNTKTNHMIIKFRYVDSKNDTLIQLADMASGAIYRSYQTDKTDSALYRGILTPKIENIWEFGI